MGVVQLKEALEEVEGVLGPQANLGLVQSRASALQTAALGSGRSGREVCPPSLHSHSSGPFPSPPEEGGAS